MSQLLLESDQIQLHVSLFLQYIVLSQPEEVVYDFPNAQNLTANSSWTLGFNEAGGEISEEVSLVVHHK